MNKILQILENMKYEELKQLAFEMLCLRYGGVDNWEWYDDSLRDGGYYDYIGDDE
jgi:hypothetical protein